MSSERRSQATTLHFHRLKSLIVQLKAIIAKRRDTWFCPCQFFMVIKTEDPLGKTVDTEAMGYGEMNSSSSSSGLIGKAAADTKYVRFWILVSGLMFFFGCHNYLQELIMSLPGFNVRRYTS